MEASLVLSRRQGLRDRVALAATNGDLRYAELVDALGTPVRSNWDAAWLATLARMVGTQAFAPHDRRDAISLYRLAQERRRLPSRHLTTLIELLLAEGQLADARNELTEANVARVPRLLRLDALNPYIWELEDDTPWRVGFRQLWERQGLEPPEVVPGPGDPFDRLVCRPSRTVAAGPLVTVVISTFEPDERLLHSVRSIARQSWTNLDILIVDDASGPMADRILDDARALDDRVRLLRLPVNQGTYMARNAGIQAAWGSIVTGQDDDDWSHPRRIERQVLPLLEDPTLPATWAHMIRATPDLRFHGVGFRPVRTAPISLTYRRAAAIAIGGFLPARRSADSEFIERMKAALGREPLGLSESLLLARVRAESLSSGDFVAGWHHPSRVAIRSSWRAWHAAMEEGATPPRSCVDRPAVPIPSEYRVDRTTPQPQGHLDVLLVGDWRHETATGRFARGLALLGRQRDVRIGFLHIESPWVVDPSARDVCRTIADLANHGFPLWVMGTGEVQVDHVVVMDPLVLDGHGPAEATPEAGRVTVVAAHPPSTARGDVLYDPAEITGRAVDAFGTSPRWAPGLHRHARMLSGIPSAPWRLPPVLPGVGAETPAGPVASQLGAALGRAPEWDLATESLYGDAEMDPSVDEHQLDGGVWMPRSLEPTFDAVLECLEARRRGLRVLAPDSYRAELGGGDGDGSSTPPTLETSEWVDLVGGSGPEGEAMR